MTQPASLERQPMLIDDTLHREFRQRYGTVAAELTMFYHQFKLYGRDFVRDWYPGGTYYRYRNTLIRDGYLTLEDFKR